MSKLTLAELEDKELEYADLNLDFSQVDFERLRHPFNKYTCVEQYREILELIRDPKNFYFTLRYILNIDPAMFQLVILEELWKRPFPMLIGSRGMSKSYLLAVYNILRMLITQGSKVLITSASFRQAKFVFDYMEKIWYDAPVLRDLCGPAHDISHGNDLYKFTMGASTTIAVPIGDGAKIRGLRATHIIAEEFACLSKNTLVETNKGLQRIIDCIGDETLSLKNRYGNWEKPERFIVTPPTDVYEITTERGYSFKCSNIHKVLTTHGFAIAKNLTSNDYLIHQEGNLQVISVVKLDEQEVLYDFYLPETNSFYGNGFIQHNSIPLEIYEVVIKGFGASASNPIENIKRLAKIKKLKERGKWTPAHEEKMSAVHKPNQVIISGTCDYSFKHFAKYWNNYHNYITSKGDPEKLQMACGGSVDPHFDYRDYSIIRIPIELIPEGMMDMKNVAGSKADMDESRYNMEYHAVFSKDSHGFFARTLIESCVCKEPIYVGNEKVQFSHRLHGDPQRKYVMSIDPASESDNFAITILELHSNHNRLVYVWTTNREKAYQRFVKKESTDNNFYAYIARKVRTLMKSFRVEYICLDSQGGGIQVMEALHDIKALEPGELPIWPLREDDPMRWPGAKDWGYDDEAGLHIIEMVSMSKADYVVEANHGLRKDLESKTLLFPMTDALSLQLAEMSDDANDRGFDTMQNLVIEIEETKQELSTITHKTTPNGNDKWETPEILIAGNKRERMRKDRYSALMMGNALARRLIKNTTIHYSEVPAGGMAHDYRDVKTDDPIMYQGADWFCRQANAGYLGYYHRRG